jgi:hypothetical protein
MSANFDLTPQYEMSCMIPLSVSRRVSCVKADLQSQGKADEAVVIGAMLRYVSIE